MSLNNTIRKKKSNPVDIGLLIFTGLFILMGIICMATASPPYALNNGLNSNYYLFHQLLYGFLPGIIFGLIATFFSLEKLKKLSLPFFIFSLILMFLPLIPGIGVTDGGASRWISLFGMSFQPSEFLKLASMMYFAALFSDTKRKNNVLPFIIVSSLIGITLILQSDLSSLVTIMGINLCIFFSAQSTKFKDWGICIGICLIGFAVLAFSSSYRMERITTLFDQSDVNDSAYQITRITDSIGSGGWFGQGLGMSAQKFGFVPETISDSIFAIYAEELGFLGTSFLILLLIGFLIKTFYTAQKSKEEFNKLLAIGVGSWIVIQSMINIWAMCGLFPICGTPLPFLSYGGSHIIVELIALGLLLNASRHLE